MKKILLAFGFFILSTNSGFAQHEEKIDLKVNQLTALEQKVESSSMFEAQKRWAYLEIDQSIELLLSYKKEEDIQKLQALELQVNITNKGVIEALMLNQKKKLLAKIKILDSLILEYTNKGMDTSKLDQLKGSMLQKIEATN